MIASERKIRTIVVAVGPRFWDDPVLPAAFELSNECGAHLHVVRAFDPPGGGTAPGDSSDSESEIERQRSEMLVGLRGQVETLGDGPVVDCHVIVGPPDEVVANLAREHDADLVAVGAARMEHLELRLLGTKAERIIARSPAPVLVLRTSVERPLRRVLLTLDPSPESEHVFEQGRNVVRALFGEDTPEYRALRVIWEPASDSPGTPDGAAPVTAALERLLDGQGARDVTPRVRAGMPAGVILAEAREWPADLVVLGTTARTAEERLLTGSVCASVLRDHAGNGLVIPTLTARSRPPQG